MPVEEYENIPGQDAVGIKFENSSFFIILWFMIMKSGKELYFAKQIH